jgi:hypothetical protein
MADGVVLGVSAAIIARADAGSAVRRWASTVTGFLDGGRLRRTMTASPVTRYAVLLLLGAAIIGCGGAAPEQANVALPLDLGELTGSWTTTVKDDEVWQGRWDLHVQGKVALLRGPDRKFMVPGLVEAAGRGVVVFGRDEACPEQRRAVGAGSYVYEVHGDDLRFKADGEDTCADRATILTNGSWTRTLSEAALPVRADAGVDPACAALHDGTATAALPGTWTLHNRTGGLVVAMARTSDGADSLLAQADGGADVDISPRRGGMWYVADLTGRCLALVGDARGVTVLSGAAPRLEHRPATDPG